MRAVEKTFVSKFKNSDSVNKDVDDYSKKMNNIYPIFLYLDMAGKTSISDRINNFDTCKSKVELHFKTGTSKSFPDEIHLETQHRISQIEFEKKHTKKL